MGETCKHGAVETISTRSHVSTNPRTKEKIDAAVKAFQNRIASDAHGKKEDFIRIARLLLEATHQSAPPINIERIAAALDAHTVKVVPWLSGKSPGRLMPDSEGFTIHISASVGEARRRFTIAHEVGHILCFDRSHRPPRLLLSKYLHDRGQRPRMEYGFNDFAREMLIPEQMLVGFRPRIKEPSCLTILELAREFRVSKEAVCWRLFRDLRIWPTSCAVLVRGVDPLVIPREEVFRGKRFHPRIPSLKLVGTSECMTSILAALGSPGKVVREGVIITGKPLCLESVAVSEGKSVLCLFTEMSKRQSPQVQTFFENEPNSRG